MPETSDTTDISGASSQADWDDRLRSALARSGDDGDQLAHRWSALLPEQYRALVDPSGAAADVRALDQLRCCGEDLLVTLRQEEGRTGTVTRLALITRGVKSELTRAIGILVDLGLRVIEERPTRIAAPQEDYWIQDFGVLGPGDAPLDLEACSARVTAAVAAVWKGEAESDALHRLIVTTELDHGRLEILRAYRRYRQRIGSRYTEGFQNDVVVSHPEITAGLIRLFELRFDPSIPLDDEAESALRAKLVEQIDAIPSLDHDRILRNQLGSIDATARTNAYVPGRRALALKMRGDEIPALPQPAPMWEVYVLAPHVEGVHIRGGMIARGGLRWSDREDFRLEVWGLMRAQMVKNAVIVPAGAKGGFRLRDAPQDPQALRAAVEGAYVDFVDALLDLTDTREGDRVVTPEGVRRRDGDDPYLVVAADKGTARFSDTANARARAHGFWLDDAFASGGSHGYDHKALGITARGAWESVKRHFRERDVDPETDAITVIGIGDMSGDVFGNGMLLSRTMRLVGAYDHRHVFLDPDPARPEASFAERRRLFELAGSSWDDYDRSLISPGGGVFSRNQKSIPLTDEIRALLGIDAERLSPAELIQALLRADVDLLWNGGIGTVVKASTESDADAGDRSSDAIRVNASELRASVVGEGGNLGFTQRARIEFARRGGAINADFIDNSGGVDSSDHEVNLKILLGEAIRSGRLDAAERDELLVAATDEIVAHVLAENARQARILTDEERRSVSRPAAYEELMVALEEHAGLVRADHDLPTTDEMAERYTEGVGMTRPELAILLSLAKLATADQLLEGTLVDDRALEAALLGYFPKAVTERFGDLVWQHPLRRELLAMLASGDVVDVMGVSFVFRRATEFGTDPTEVVRAFLIAREVCDAARLIGEVEAAHLDADLRWELSAVVQDAVRQVSRWYLRHEADDARDLRDVVAEHRDAAAALTDTTEKLGGRPADEQQRWEEAGVSSELAAAVARCRLLPFAPYVAGVAARTGIDVERIVVATQELRHALPLDALQSLIAELPAGTRIARWANQALRDDYLSAVSRLAGVLLTGGGIDAAAAARAGLERRHAEVRRLTQLVREAQLSQHTQVAGTTLAVRQLREMAGWLGPSPTMG